MSTHQWNNRIIRQADVPPATLLAHPDNVALHDAEQLDLLEAVLQHVGWVDRIVVSAATQRILDGHARVIVALRNGEATVPVQEVAATDDEERLGLVVLNRLARLAQLDLGKLDVLLTGVEAVTDDPVLRQGLDDFAAFAGLRDDPLDDTLVDDDALVDDDDDLPTTTDADDALSLTQVRVGDYVVQVPRAVYDAWLDAVRVEVGFDAASINQAIRRRLGIEPLSE